MTAPLLVAVCDLDTSISYLAGGCPHTVWDDQLKREVGLIYDEGLRDASDRLAAYYKVVSEARDRFNAWHGVKI